MKGTTGQSDPLAGLAERFRRAERSFPTSPLYRRLVTGVAGDPELLAMAAHGRPGQAPEFLLLGAVHLLLGRRPDEPLARWYPDLSPGQPPAGDPFPAFRSFCHDHRDDVVGLVATRLVQTNEPRRSAALLLGLATALRDDPRPFGLVEVGASAGLNLRYDRYRYDFGAGLAVGDPAAPVVIRCPAEGPHPPRPAAIPRPARRVGIDLHPVDVTDPEEVRWLSALLSPEDDARRRLLLAACEQARTEPPELVAGDVFDVLPRVVEALPPGMPVCVFHSSVLFHFPPALRPTFAEMVAGLARLGPGRDVHWLSLEGAGTTHTFPQPPQRNHQVLGLTTFAGGMRSDRVLALVDPHGGWLEWLAPVG